MSFYAKKPHPFASCVRDNRKRFGPDAERVCAVLKDLILNTTKWRNGGKHMSEDIVLAEAEHYEIDQELADFLVALPERAVETIFEVLIGEDE